MRSCTNSLNTQRYNLTHRQGDGGPGLYHRLCDAVIQADLERVALYLKIIVQNGPEHTHRRICPAVAQSGGGGIRAAPDQLQLQIIHAYLPLQRPAGLSHHRQQLHEPGKCARLILFGLWGLFFVPLRRRRFPLFFFLFLLPGPRLPISF